jgi:3-oxoacyl-[acyl-carrier protein] reductase
MSNNIVITGASSQIGQAIAKRLISEGDRAMLHCCRNSSACKSLVESTRAYCEIALADFTKQDDLSAFCNALEDVDILVNAAACTKADLLPNLSDEDISNMIAVNIKALATICRAVIPAMMVKRRGIIVNISSVAALRGNRGQSVYAGTNGFVESFTRSLAAEFGSRGIRVNSVAPGAIDAGSMKELLLNAEDLVKKSTAMNRLGSPEDVAAAVSFLCSSDAAFINGACINVSGGFMMGV